MRCSDPVLELRSQFAAGAPLERRRGIISRFSASLGALVYPDRNHTECSSLWLVITKSTQSLFRTRQEPRIVTAVQFEPN